MEEQVKQKQIKEVTSKEEAIDSLNKLHILAYGRMKGKGLSIIEKTCKDEEELKQNKDLYIQYITSISNDISNTIRRALEFLK